MFSHALPAFWAVIVGILPSARMLKPILGNRVVGMGQHQCLNRTWLIWLWQFRGIVDELWMS